MHGPTVTARRVSDELPSTVHSVGLRTVMTRDELPSTDTPRLLYGCADGRVSQSCSLHHPLNANPSSSWNYLQSSSAHRLRHFKYATETPRLASVNAAIRSSAKVFVSEATYAPAEDSQGEAARCTRSTRA